MGKALSWVLAGLFGAFALIMIVKFAFFPSPTSPSLTGPTGMLSFQRPEEPLALVIGSEPAAAGDAGGDYRLAMDVYRENTQAIDEMIEHARDGDLAGGEYRYTPEQLALLGKVAAHVADAAAKKEMSFYFRLTPKEIKRPYFAVEVDRFQELYDVLDVLVMHHVFVGGEQEYPEAEKCLFHALVMGRHMVDERARLDIVKGGLAIQESACDTLIWLYRRWKKPDRVDAVKAYKGGLLEITRQYTALQAVIWGIESRWRCPHPGDVFNLAAHHADRAVRVEAIIVLGIIRHGQIGRGDQRIVRKLIDQKLRSSDELEAAAAKAADEMTQEDLRMMDRELRQL